MKVRRILSFVFAMIFCAVLITFAVAQQNGGSEPLTTTPPPPTPLPAATPGPPSPTPLPTPTPLPVVSGNPDRTYELLKTNEWKAFSGMAHRILGANVRPAGFVYTDGFNVRTGEIRPGLALRLFSQTGEVGKIIVQSVNRGGEGLCDEVGEIVWKKSNVQEGSYLATWSNEPINLFPTRITPAEKETKDREIVQYLTERNRWRNVKLDYSLYFNDGGRIFGLASVYSDIPGGWRRTSLRLEMTKGIEIILYDSQEIQEEWGNPGTADMYYFLVDLDNNGRPEIIRGFFGEFCTWLEIMEL